MVRANVIRLELPLWPNFCFFFREDVKAMFAERDKDRDGHLSFEEFSGQETKMERAFKSMDKDGDGFITKAEFKLVCKNLTKGIYCIFCNCLFTSFNVLVSISKIYSTFNYCTVKKYKVLLCLKYEYFAITM